MALNFAQWLETAKPGDRLCYHVGNLAADRAIHLEGKATTSGPHPLADKAAALAEAGLVALTQRLLSRDLYTGLSTYEYFATRI